MDEKNWIIGGRSTYENEFLLGNSERTIFRLNSAWCCKIIDSIILVKNTMLVVDNLPRTAPSILD